MSRCDSGETPQQRGLGLTEEAIMAKPTLSKYQVHPDLSTLFPPLTKAEYEELQRSIKLEGCRDPITVAGGFVIDGHNRLTICQTLGIAPQVRDLSDLLKAEADRKIWMMSNQLGRRNLKPADASRLRAELVALYKANGKLASAGRYGKQPGQKTMDELGAEVGVTGRQLRDDVKQASSKPEPSKPEPTSGLKSKPEAISHEAERDAKKAKALVSTDTKFDYEMAILSGRRKTLRKAIKKAKERPAEQVKEEASPLESNPDIMSPLESNPDIMGSAETARLRAARKLGRARKLIRDGKLLMGSGLRRIRDGALYDKEDKSFLDYCMDKHGLSLAEADRLIKFYEAYRQTRFRLRADILQERALRGAKPVPTEESA